ncbi:MAG: type II-A CRISPR-associated protein Csn2 [Clostridia bacterium]|nr:type II-A CRISPR-associated protein Csn2 [Clostridia bacterium]
MKLLIKGFENEVVFSNQYINVIQIENKALFQSITNQLNTAINGEVDETDVVLLSDNGDELDFENTAYMMTDLYNIDINNKKILTKIQEKILKDFSLENVSNIDKNIQEIREILISEVNEFPLEIGIKDDVRLNDILKLFCIRIEKSNFTDIVKRIEAVIDIIANLKVASILVIPNIRSYLDNYQIIEIYKYSLYNGIRILILESNKYKKSKYEKVLLIDKNFDDYYV